MKIVNVGVVMRGRGVSAAICAAALLLAGVAPVATQGPEPTPRAGWVIGGALGAVGPEGLVYPMRVTVGAQWTQLRPGRLGADLAAGTAPNMILMGLVWARAGATLPVALTPDVFLLPTAGVSGVGILLPGADPPAVGLNSGISAMAFVNRSLAVRTGVTAHRLLGVDGTVWLAEVGLMRTRR
jgi:hypothetical protein